MSGTTTGDSLTAPAGEATPRAGDRDLTRFVTGLLPAARSGTLAVLDQAAVSGARFLTTMLIGRLCGAGELGVYSLGFSLVIIVACVQEALLATPYAIFCNRFTDGTGRGYAGSLLVQHWLLALLSTTALLVTGAVIAAGTGPQELGGIIWVLAAIMPFILLQEFGRRYCFAHLRMRAALGLDAAVAALQIGGLLLLAATSTLTVRRACLVIGFGSAVPALVWLWRSRAEFTPGAHRFVADLRLNLDFGKWVFASQMVGALRTYVLLWFLALVHDTAATGAFAAASSIVLASNPLTMGISNLLTPKAARAFQTGGAHAVGRVVGRATLPLGVAIALFCLALLWIGDPIMQFLYGADFAGYRHLLFVLGLGLLVRTLALCLDAGLRAMGRPDVNLKAGFASLLVTVGLAFLFVGRWSADGAAYCLLAGSGLGLLLRVQIFLRMVA